jgi:HEAT repeat protein
MTRLFSKLFNIRPAEWPRFSLLYLMLFLMVTSLVWSSTILEAAFLAQGGGVDALRWFFIVKALVAIPAVALYTGFADRLANNKLLIAILGFTVTGILAGLALLYLGLSALAYALLYLIVFVPMDDIMAIQWYTYVNGFYDTQAAKRIIPVLSTALVIAAMIAGYTMDTLNARFAPYEVTAVMIIWIMTLLLIALLVWLMPYFIRETKTGPKLTLSQTGLSAAKPHASYLDNIREGFRYVTQSTFLRWMALSTLVLMTLTTFVQYQTSVILQTQLQTTERISTFIGTLTGLVNLIMLPILLFLFNRIIGRLGLANANLIYPIGFLLICLGLIWPTNNPTVLLIAAALAYFGRTYFYTNIGYPIEGLLYNAVPPRVKGRARAFIGGFLVPVGTLVGGILLLVPFIILDPYILSASIGLLAMGYVAIAFVIRRQYTQALIKMLEQEDFSFLLSHTASTLSITDSATLNRLRQKLEESTSPEFTIFIAKLISQIGGNSAVTILGQVARSTTQPRTRAAIIDVLVASDTRSEAVYQLYQDFLADPDGQVRQSAIAGLEQLSGPHDKQFLALAFKLLHDPDLEVRVRVLPPLLTATDTAQQSAAEKALQEFLQSTVPHHRARTMRILGQTGDPHLAVTLLDYLNDPADEVRLEAIIAIETLVQTKNLSSERLLETIPPLVHDPVERVRQAALVILGQVDSRQTYPVLVEALTDTSLQVRNTAVNVLAQKGKVVIPILHPALNSPNPVLRKMGTVTLSRINYREYGSMIGAHITGNLLEIYRNYGRLEALAPYAKYQAITVMQNMLQEHSQQLTQEVFYLLTAIHPPDAIKVIIDSFENEDVYIRANAAEALESLTSPQTSQLVSPLFDPDIKPAQLVKLGHDVWDMTLPDTATTLKQLITDPTDPWLRAITTYALGEMGATLQAAGPIVPPKPAPLPTEATKRSHRRPADLLAALVNNNDNPNAASSPPVHIDPPPAAPANGSNLPFTLAQIRQMLEVSFADPSLEVRMAAQDASDILAGLHLADIVKARQEGLLLSTVEKIIFLKEVPFFQGMTIDQLKILANVCEEEFFEADTRIYNQNDPGGILYVVVSGRVAIELEKRKGSFARLATIEAHSYFGEMNLFDNSPRSTAALALQDTLTLRLRREPLIALARQYPDLSLELINVLSQRLRESSDRVADLTRTRPRELHKLFDTYE